MSSIADKAKIARSRISFRMTFEGALDGLQADPIEQVAMEVQSDGEAEDYVWMGTVPGFEEWLDERKLSGLRAEGFRVKNRDFVDHVLNGKSTMAPAEHGLMVQQMLDGIYESSAKGGKEVSIK